MERVGVDEVPPDSGPAPRRRDLTAALDTSEVALNRYRLAPGEGFPGGLHAHADQEELFVVLSGVVTFETYLPDEDRAGEVTVEAGEAIRFAPGEFQSGRNTGDDELVALALGAPRDGTDVRVPLPCPDCGHGPLRLETDGDVTFECPDCGAEHAPVPCPACGDGDLRATLRAESVVVACRDCGATFEDPPLADE